MSRLALIVLATIALFGCLAPLWAAGELAAGFNTPPDWARPWVYWFWLNGNITREGITRDLEAMARQGIGGVLIMEVDQGAPVGPVDFASDEWRDLFKFVCSEADRLGLKVNMNSDAGWNGSGGPWITPALAMQKVTWSETPVTGPSFFDGDLPQPPTVWDYYQDIAVLAVPATDWRIPDILGKAAFRRQDFGNQASYGEAPEGQSIPREQVIDITSSIVAPGHLHWAVPEGKWTILRFGFTPTGAVNAPAPASGTGPEPDKLSKAGAKAAIDGFIGKLAADNASLTGKSFVRTHIDSWENGSQNWTPLMPQEFEALRGYDLKPFLPVFTGRVVDSLEVSERFLWDLRQTVSDLLLENHAAEMARLAAEHGLGLSIEAYGDTTVDNLAYAGRADEPMGEFWSWPSFGAEGTLTEMASAAHLYGRPIVGAEAFTAGDGEKWLYDPAFIKAMGDRAYCLGINRFVFHRYAMQPWTDRRPGMTMGPWGLHWERTQTWWEESGAYHQYLARCQFLLQQGKPVVDLLYLAPEGAPRDYNAPPSLEATGYKGDACPTEIVLKRLSVKDGLLVTPEGMSYRALVLPGSPTMTPELLAKLSWLARSGATIIGSSPEKACGLTGYPEADAEVAEAAAKLWESGRILPPQDPTEWLAQHGIAPDFTSDRNLTFVHHQIGDLDLYFVSNPFKRAVNATCSFRMKDKHIELWDPETGQISPVASYQPYGDRTLLPLRLEQSQAVFVVFRPGKPTTPVVSSITEAGTRIWPAEPAQSQVTILRAIWGPRRSRDVTGLVQRIVDSGRTSFPVMELLSAGDPAPNIVKTLTVDYEVEGKQLSAAAKDGETISLQVPSGAKVAIARATWGPAGDADRFKDVTEQVQNIVEAGRSSFVVAELASKGDPAPGIVKTLDVEYESEGQHYRTSATDSESIYFQLQEDEQPRLMPFRDAEGALKLEVSQAGEYEVVLSDGSSRAFTGGAPRKIDVLGSWDLTFSEGWGAPARATFTTLTSWSDSPDEGIKYFSGAATYHKTLRLPRGLFGADRRICLDLGRVASMARVKLNGQDLGLLWKAPFRLDITRVARPGDNQLEIEVTNLWPNRMIGDELLPEDSDRNPNGTLKAWPDWLEEDKPSPTGRFTFTSWRLWHAGDELQPSGLLGPVTVTSTQLISLD